MGNRRILFGSGTANLSTGFQNSSTESTPFGGSLALLLCALFCTPQICKQTNKPKKKKKGLKVARHLPLSTPGRHGVFAPREAGHPANVPPLRLAMLHCMPSTIPSVPIGSAPRSLHSSRNQAVACRGFGGQVRVCSGGVPIENQEVATGADWWVFQRIA